MTGLLATVPGVSTECPPLADLTHRVMQRALRRAEHGYWLNSGHDGQPKGYDCFVIEPRRWWPKYRVDIMEDHPPTYVGPDCFQYRAPERSFLSDFGTIPRVVQVWIPSTRYPCSFMWHDLLCDKDGLLVSEDGGATWDKLQFSRSQSDDLLWDMVLAEGATHAEACAIHAGVRCWALASGQWR